GELPFPPERLDAPELLGERPVPRLEHRREAEVLLRVLVAAVEAGVVLPRGGAAPRGAHLPPPRPPETPPPPPPETGPAREAAAGEERVAREDRALGREVIGDVPARVRRDHDDPAGERADLDRVAVVDAIRDAGDARGVAGGAVDPERRLRGEQIRIAAHVV